MHKCYTFANVDEYLKNFGFRESLSQSSIHHVDDTSAGAELHEDEDLVCAIGHTMPSGVDEKNNVGVALEDALGNMCSQGAQEEMMWLQLPLYRPPS